MTLLKSLQSYINRTKNKVEELFRGFPKTVGVNSVSQMTDFIEEDNL